MNFKSFGLGLFIVTAGVAGTILTKSPAQAITIGSGDILGLSGSARLQNANVAIGSTSRINFFAYTNTTSGTLQVQGASTGAFNSLATQAATILDLDLKKTAVDVWEFSPFSGYLTNFITVADVKYDLSKFTLKKVGGLFTADFEGLFRSTNEIAGFGSFAPANSSNFPKSSGSTIAIDVTTVPTPALLPGLLALGVGALRKRKTEAIEAGKTNA